MKAAQHSHEVTGEIKMEFTCHPPITHLPSSSPTPMPNSNPSQSPTSMPSSSPTQNPTKNPTPVPRSIDCGNNKITGVIDAESKQRSLSFHNKFERPVTFSNYGTGFDAILILINSTGAHIRSQRREHTAEEFTVFALKVGDYKLVVAPFPVN